jgi:UDP-N-acetylmuramyl-tripeptide synthetase
MFSQVFPVTSHTDHVGPNTTFVVVAGMKEHGAQYIALALEKGANTIVIEHNCKVEQDIIDLIAKHAAKLEYVENARKALAELSAQAHNYPAQKLKIIGITATKGKTTTAFLTEHAIAQAGYKTALLSSVHNKINGTILKTTLTTRQPDYLHAFFAECVRQGVEYVVMEVAAQAISLYRVHGIAFDALIFMNFAQEHAEFYASYDDYFDAKAAIIQYAKPNAPILLCANDARIAALAAQCNNPILYQQSANSTHDSLQGLLLNYDTIQYKCPVLCGTYNINNIVAALEIIKALQIPISYRVFENFPGVPGRLTKYVMPNGCTIFLDYAHNPSSYEALLSTLRKYTSDLIVIFGCGGGKDPLKRPVMGNIAAQYADKIMLTSDNPRYEDPAAIIEAIQKGIAPSDRHKVQVELDRSKAIQKAYDISTHQSIIAILGKGLEEYQEIQGIKLYYCDAQEVIALQK